MESEPTTLKLMTNWGELEGDFRENKHGWFAVEVNGLKWPYEKCVQIASKTPEEAANSLLAHHEDEPDWSEAEA